jgi:hypothetical protein
MAIIINAGSENKGGTFEQAEINAKEWLEIIHSQGFDEVEMEFIEQHKDGDFQFNFTHKVTGKVATLEIHGFTKEECQNFRFHPRVYWNGSSNADPKIEDWLNDGFKYRVEFYRS